MWFSLSEQTAYFLWSIALGAGAAVLYDIVRAVRIFLKAGKLHLIISDAVFFALCGILTSLFALPFNKGDVRAFIVFGEAVGFLCYRLTIGQVSGRFYSILSKGITWILRKICDLLKKFFDLLLKIASRLLYNVGVVKDKALYIVSANRKKRKSAAGKRSGKGKNERKHKKKNKKSNKSRRARGARRDVGRG